MTRPGIKPWSPRPLANTLPTGPLNYNVTNYYGTFIKKLIMNKKKSREIRWNKCINVRIKKINNPWQCLL